MSVKTFKEFISEQKVGEFELDTVTKNTQFGTVNIHMFKNKGKPNEKKYWFEVSFDGQTLDAYYWDTSEEDYIEDKNLLKTDKKLKSTILKLAKGVK